MGKEIPLAIIFALFAQTAGAVWWAATQSAKLDALTEMVKGFRETQYTQNDARRDMESILQRHRENARRIEVIENAIRRREL